MWGKVFLPFSTTGSQGDLVASSGGLPTWFPPSNSPVILNVLSHCFPSRTEKGWKGCGAREEDASPIWHAVLWKRGKDTRPHLACCALEAGKRHWSCLLQQGGLLLREAGWPCDPRAAPQPHLGLMAAGEHGQLGQKSSLFE